MRIEIEGILMDDNNEGLHRIIRDNKMGMGMIRWIFINGCIRGSIKCVEYIMINYMMSKEELEIGKREAKKYSNMGVYNSIEMNIINRLINKKNKN